MTYRGLAITVQCHHVYVDRLAAVCVCPYLARENQNYAAQPSLNSHLYINNEKYAKKLQELISVVHIYR